mmetsp:Transcript_708/g.1090  ORF Transcript_708/g.1090 Transcript_708/m.1090 type:complete len:92 (+) Transcript_708:216-491(+)
MAETAGLTSRLAPTLVSADVGIEERTAPSLRHPCVTSKTNGPVAPMVNVSKLNVNLAPSQSAIAAPPIDAVPLASETTRRAGTVKLATTAA